jgi:hypothetical protein
MKRIFVLAVAVFSLAWWSMGDNRIPPVAMASVDESSSNQSRLAVEIDRQMEETRSAVAAEMAKVQSTAPSVAVPSVKAVPVYLRPHQRWGIPGKSEREATTLALFRVCVSEGGWERPEDCAAIWQVVSNIRGCADATGERVRCSDPSAAGRESKLSAMRRAAGRVLGVRPPLLERQRWTSSLRLDCEEPDGWPRRISWRAYRKRCKAAVGVARKLVRSKAPEKSCEGNPIAWGGEMDNHLACMRGLAMSTCELPDGSNNFWCRPGREGCADVREPICDEILANYRRKQGLPRRVSR